MSKEGELLTPDQIGNPGHRQRHRRETRTQIQDLLAGDPTLIHKLTPREQRRLAWYSVNLPLIVISRVLGIDVNYASARLKHFLEKLTSNEVPISPPTEPSPVVRTIEDRISPFMANPALHPENPNLQLTTPLAFPPQLIELHYAQRSIALAEALAQVIDPQKDLTPLDQHISEPERAIKEHLSRFFTDRPDAMIRFERLQKDDRRLIALILFEVSHEEIARRLSYEQPEAVSEKVTLLYQHLLASDEGGQNLALPSATATVDAASGENDQAQPTIAERMDLLRTTILEGPPYLVFIFSDRERQILDLILRETPLEQIRIVMGETDGSITRMVNKITSGTEDVKEIFLNVSNAPNYAQLRERFSDPERRVFDLIVAGYSQADAAREMGLSPKAVQAKVRNIKSKITDGKDPLKIVFANIHKRYPTLIEHLSDTQRIIFQLIIQGHKQTEIATMLGVSKQTIGTHVLRIRIKIKNYKPQVTDLPV